MRNKTVTVAVLATAVVLSCLASPALAGGHKWSFPDGKVIHKGPFTISFNKIPGKPAQGATSPTNTITYFGTCLNLAGNQQAGNADADGTCLPYESLIGNEGNNASEATDDTCQVTTSYTPKAQAARGFNWNQSWSKTKTVPCTKKHRPRPNVQ